jgi:predicted homoserine dehydrogenase-like protein
LKRGQLLDGIGGFDCYGMIENSDTTRTGDFLPMGLSEGCRLKRDVGRDEVIRYQDVDLPGGRLCDRLREQQNEVFPL